MKHKPSRIAPTTTATKTNTDRETANLEVVEGFFTALVKN